MYNVQFTFFLVLQVVAKGPVWEVVTLERDFSATSEAEDFVARIPGALSILVELDQVRCRSMETCAKCFYYYTYDTIRYDTVRYDTVPVHLA